MTVSRWLFRLARTRRSVLGVLVLCLAASGWAAQGSLRAQAAPQPIPAPISAQALAQIVALQQEKLARTPAERKIDSRLLRAIKQQRGEGLPALRGLRPSAAAAADARDRTVDVEIAAEPSGALMTALRANGAAIVSRIETRAAGQAAGQTAGQTVRARLTYEGVLAMAARADVRWVQAYRPPMLNRAATGAARTPSAIGSSLVGSSGVGTNLGPTGQGSRSSEGDAAHQAHVARALFGLDGTGVKIGVLSDGVTSLAQAQALGDLGPVTVLPGQAGSGDEGTAMLEIIHDVAPGAQLYFATAFSGAASFAQNIRDLRAAGCDIIVDDIFYFVESPFQDGQAAPTNTNGGVIAQAVNDVTAAGALYFSSAGNSGNLDDGTSGVWEGDFVDGGPVTGPLTGGGQVHDFGGGQLWNVLSQHAPYGVTLHWSDPLGAASSDYDLFILSPDGVNVYDASTNVQDGTQDPYEEVGESFANERVLIVRFAGNARFLHLDSIRGRLSIATDGQIRGHMASIDAYAVAATPASSADGGPYPNAFSSANVSETFTSDGPRRLFYQADGTPFTPGNVSSSGGVVRQKPDITAADGTTVTGVGGFPTPFYGTSASAPHAAAIAALIKQARPAGTPLQMRTWLTSTALDIEAPGVDRNTGAGIIMPIPALQAAGATATGAAILIDSFTATENPGNGDGLLYGGEGGALNIVLSNEGSVAATAVSATLTTTTPGVRITQPAVRGFGSIAPAGTATASLPFTFTLPTDAACSLDVMFTLTVTMAEHAPQTLTIRVPTGGISITDVLDTTAPAGSISYTGSTVMQTSRITPSTPSTCGATRPFPGVTGVDSLRGDLYELQTCAAAAPACATVSVTATTGSLFSASYKGSYDPTAIATNYAGDAGRVGPAMSYGVQVAGGDSLLVAIHETAPGNGDGAGYNLRVSGACFASCTRNRLPNAIAEHTVVVNAGPDGTAAVSVDAGSNDPDGDPLTITQEPAGPYRVGYTGVRLTVTDPSGATSQADATVVVLPIITGISPTSGPIAGGTAVTVTGAGFDTAPGATWIAFHGTPATSVTCSSPSECIAIAPPRATPWVVDVRATIAGITTANTPADDFTYVHRTYLLAEGATGSFFDEDVLIANPHATAAPVTMRFFKEDGTVVTEQRTIAPESRQTIHVDELSGLEATAVSAEVTSESGLPLAVERSMFWDASYYAGHTAGAVSAADTTWHFAEGSQGFFDTYVLVNNPHATPTDVTFTFLREKEAPITHTVTLKPSSRYTLPASTIEGLWTRSFAITVTATQPVTAERAMYFGTTADRLWSGGTASAGSALSSVWHYAEGATGAFSTYFLLGNPHDQAANVEVKYLLDSGEVVIVPKVVPGHERLTIDVAAEADPRMRQAAFAAVISSDRPIVSERSMYWAGKAQPWGEAHNTAGVDAPAVSWGLAEGRLGGERNYRTYILLSNPEATAAEVSVTFLLESGQAITRPYTVNGHSRFTLDASTIEALANQRFGARIDVTNHIGIVVERSMYWDANGVVWAGGSNGVGVRMP